MSVRPASRKAIDRNKLGHVTHFAVDSTDPSAGEAENFTFTSFLDDANIVTSQTKEDPHLHSVVLDLDLNAELVPSTTPGHFHLYVDKTMTWDDYKDLISVLARVGIIEPGYAGASFARGFTAVRLPWVKKETEPQPVATDVEPVIPGTELTESKVRQLAANGVATKAEEAWLAMLDAAKDPF